jgi:hypothetical protein
MGAAGPLECTLPKTSSTALIFFFPAIVAAYETDLFVSTLYVGA